MTDKELRSLYELKGQLGARCLSIEHDIDTLSRLGDKVETTFYKGYVQGQIDTLIRVREDVHRYLDSIVKIIKGAEDA